MFRGLFHTEKCTIVLHQTTTWGKERNLRKITISHVWTTFALEMILEILVCKAETEMTRGTQLPSTWPDRLFEWKNHGFLHRFLCEILYPSWSEDAEPSQGTRIWAQLGSPGSVQTGYVQGELFKCFYSVQSTNRLFSKQLLTFGLTLWKWDVRILMPHTFAESYFGVSKVLQFDVLVNSVHCHNTQNTAAVWSVQTHKITSRVDSWWKGSVGISWQLQPFSWKNRWTAPNT